VLNAAGEKNTTATALAEWDPFALIHLTECDSPHKHWHAEDMNARQVGIIY